MKREIIDNRHSKLLKSYGLEKFSPENIFILSFSRDEYIYRQGYEIEHLLFIADGSMKVFITAPNGNALLLCTYESGVVGDIELLLDDNAAASSVQAITDVTCIGIPVKRAREELRANIVFSNKIAEGVAKKLSENSRSSAANILNPLKARLCSYIALTSREGFFSEKRTVLSEMLGTSYRHLLRTLDRLCAEGVLKKEKKGYAIVDGKALEGIAEGNNAK